MWPGVSASHRADPMLAQVKERRATRFNSMLQELYGGRRAIRTYLLTGRFVDIRLPPLGRNPEGVRLPMPKPRARPNGAERRAKYYSRLAKDLDDCAQTGEARDPPPHHEALGGVLAAGGAGVPLQAPRVGGKQVESGARGRSPARREDSWDRRPRPRAHGSGWGGRQPREEFQDKRCRRH